jgi:hypothetical protein
MLIAQGLGEYGALSGGGLANFFDNIEYSIRDGNPTTWAAIFCGVVVIWFFFLRTR